MAVNDIRVSEHFLLSEFASHDTGEVIVDPDLIVRLEKMRQLLSLPIVVDSGYRTPEHNAAVGGVPKSLHCKGRAVDIKCAFVSLPLLLAAAIWAGFPGVLVYTKYSFLHCDLREVPAYLIPDAWIPGFKLLFPDRAKSFYPWSDITDVKVVEL
jgi:hypothetical protein